MSVYANQRKGLRASDKCIKYYLDKYRETFHLYENNRRKELKERANEHLY